MIDANTSVTAKENGTKTYSVGEAGGLVGNHSTEHGTGVPKLVNTKHSNMN